KILPPLFLISTCIKILLIPTYRSTDFDVHRNWLAITRNTPISEWYWNDVNGTTVHTLDYPPAFAFFESFLSNNFITEIVLPQGDKCLDLLPDFDNTPSQSCVVFQRSTVIFSDIILWIGAYFACRSLHPRRPLQFVVTSFLLIVFNPALLWLDHIHFQYNGMILGVLLASLGCLMMGNNVAIVPENGNHTLALVTGTTLVLPWIPFIMCEDPKSQILQILKRLFPFQRGLVHDYWAGNIWALYTFANRVLIFAVGRLGPKVRPMLSEEVSDILDGMYLPEPSPLICAVLLFLSIIPGLQMASSRLTNKKLIEAVVYVSLCSFMLAYHVHEKAILTTMIPLTLLVEPNPRGEYYNLLFWNITLWGLLGLFPLLYRTR
ncbi:putative ALG6_ALG8 type glycosyltransferase, partial [Fragilariopsis cylindrus CCMP1102]